MKITKKMKIFFKTMLLMMLLISTSSLLAQEIQTDSLNFSGSVLNTNKSGIQGSLWISYNKIDGFNDWDPGTIRMIQLDSIGSFRFNLPDLHKPYKIYFVIKGKEENLYSRAFYLESRDSIRMNIIVKKIDYPKAVSVKFTGVGSEKYNIIEQVQNQFDQNYLRNELAIIDIGKSPTDTSDVNLKMEKLAALLKKFKMKKATLIRTSNLRPEMRMMVNYEFARYDSEWVWQTRLFSRNNPNYQKQIYQNYLKHDREFFESPNIPAKFCPYYLKSISNRDVLKLMIVNESDKVKLKDLYDFTKANYSGFVRDRLLGRVLAHPDIDKISEPYSLSTKDSLLKDALSLISLSYVKDFLDKQIDHIARTSNAKVIEAEFIGLDGKKFSLSSLKGKVYLIDTWFKGCVPCADFHKIFENDIYPKLKDNVNFAIVSISMDRTKDRWLSGIASKRYTSTSERYINVWTQNFMDHPFLKYYLMQRGCALMLVDKDGTILLQPLVISKDELIGRIMSALNNSNIRSLQ